MYNNCVKTKNYTLEEFQNEAVKFASNLFVGNSAVTVALHGDLGAGKTTFAQSMARAFGVGDCIVSPTFIIQKRYSLEGQIFSYFVHIDAYRLKNSEQLEVLDWNDLAQDPSNLIVIEWPENVEGILTQETKHIYFEYIDENTRTVMYNSKK